MEVKGVERKNSLLLKNFLNWVCTIKKTITFVVGITRYKRKVK